MKLFRVSGSGAGKDPQLELRCLKKTTAPELQKFVQLLFLSSGAEVYFSMLKGSAPELEKIVFFAARAPELKFISDLRKLSSGAQKIFIFAARAPELHTFSEQLVSGLDFLYNTSLLALNP